MDSHKIPQGSTDLFQRPTYFETLYGKGFFFTVGANCLEVSRNPDIHDPLNARIIPIVGNPWFVLSPTHVAVNIEPPETMDLTPQQKEARALFLQARRHHEDLFPNVADIRGALLQRRLAPRMQGTLLSLLSSNVLLLVSKPASFGPDVHRDPRRELYQGEWLNVAAIVTGNGNPSRELLTTLTPIERVFLPLSPDSSRLNLPLLHLRGEDGLSFNDAEKMAAKKERNGPLVQTVRRLEKFWTLSSKAQAIDYNHPREFGLSYDRLRVYDLYSGVLQDNDRHPAFAKTTLFDPNQNTMAQFIIAVWRLPPNHTINFLGADGQSYRDTATISDPSTPSSAKRLLDFMIAYGSIKDKTPPKRCPPVTPSNPHLRLVA